MKNKELNESLKIRAREEFARVPFARLLGMEIIDVSHGEAILKLETRDELRQPQGVLHGGATASVIDTAMAFAVISCLAENEKATTVDLTVHYLRPVSKGEIVCTAKVARAGRRILTVSAECVNAEGKLTATALSTYAKLQ
ncbi:MAG TPA: PaaI family thioesterase [Pyrinomonadaceae bacterium]|nr:PaaI family thioesterase [Pyrinomonadaceae bacterium]